jgi:penicillin-binding protein 1A
VTNRRNVVLSQMAKGKSSQRGKEKLQSLPIKLNFKLETTKTEATYFREYLRDYMKNGLKKIKTRWIRL